MREILFRGKNVDNGAWVYGSFIPDMLEVFCITDIDGFIKPFSLNKEELTEVRVERSTVGQFTGLTDKNGKKIFAGDIISTSSKLIGAVEWNDTFAKYIVCYNQISGNWFDFEGEDCFSVALDCVIIGNIHDNPELLK